MDIGGKSEKIILTIVTIIIIAQLFVLGVPMLLGSFAGLAAFAVNNSFFAIFKSDGVLPLILGAVILILIVGYLFSLAKGHKR